MRVGFVPIQLTAALALLLPALGHAQHCSRDWACVEVVETSQGIEFFAHNRKNYPIAMTLQVLGPEGEGGNRDPVSLSLPGNSRIPVTTLPEAGKDFRFEYDWTVGSLNPDHDDYYIYALPYGQDRAYPVIQGWGSRFTHTGPEHFTVDFRMPEGSFVHAAREGVVAMVEDSHELGCFEPGCGRFANFVIILHDDDTTGEYYHLQHRGVLVRPGDRVARGQPIALSGNTGRSNTPHLHFGVYRATAWGRTQSIGIQFESRRGVVSRPRVGALYHHPRRPEPPKPTASLLQ